MSKKLKTAKLDLLWWGASVGGEHYYAHLCFDDKDGKYNRIELTHRMSQKMADYLNKKDRTGSFCYEKGEKTQRFETVSQAVKAAVKKCKEVFPDVELILDGGCSGSVREALWGDKKIVSRINQLYEEAMKLNYYSGKDDNRMEQIDDEFTNIINGKLDL